MKFLFKHGWLALGALLVLGSATAGAVQYHRHELATLKRQYDDYLRQLQGQLTEEEQRIQELNTALGLTSSDLVTAKALQEKYQASLTEKDKELEDFRRQHDLQVRAMQTAIL